MDDTPRCMLLFENACTSPKTYKSYKGFLDVFLKWSCKDYQSLLMLTQNELEELLQDYCIILKRRCNDGELNPNSIVYIFNGVFKFLKVNKKTFDRDAISQLFPERIKLSGEKAITTEECQIMLDSTGEKREKALLGVFTSTGARPESVCLLQLKSISEYTDGFLKLVLYPGSTHEMVTFLHREAASYLLNYFEERKKEGEKLTDESYAFRSHSRSAAFLKPRPLSVQTIEGMMFRLWEKSGIKRVKKGRNYDLKVTGAFRKRFDTLLEFHQPEIPMGAIQYLMDHTGYMSGSHYRRPTVQQVFDAYKKCVLELMISDKARLEAKQKQKEIEFENRDLEKDKRVRELERRIENTERLLLEIKDRINH